MSFDGTFIHSSITELTPIVVNSRITKIQMPSSFEIILTIRQKRKNHNLEISIHPEFQQINLTNQSFIAPRHPYPFTMILRKYLQGAQIKELEQIGNDRIVLIHLNNINDLGDKINFALIAEMMGRRANVLLVDEKNQKIIDLLKRENIDSESKRTLMPDFTYEFPEFQQKLNPFNYLNKTNDLTFPRPTEKEITKFLTYFQGIGKDTKKELTFRMLKTEPTKAWKQFFGQLDHPKPTIYYDDNKQPVNFTIFPYKSINLSTKEFSSISELLDSYFAEKSAFARNKQAAQSMLTHVDGLLKKDQRKLLNLKKDLKKAQNSDNYRIKGDLITIHLNEIKQGLKKITIENNYEPDTEITISLDPELTPQKNAQKYYKKYRKLQNSIKHINQQLENTEDEINYLETILTQINLADYNTLDEIKNELIKEKYLKVQDSAKKHYRPVKSKPLEYTSSDGTKILVGRNNMQNERLTLHDSQKTDYWLHTKNIPGSHVIIKNAAPSEQTIYEGAMIAAYYSKSRHSAQVPVDYVPIKNIKKPNGSKPGFVIFTGQKTIFVTPQESLITKLKA